MNAIQTTGLIFYGRMNDGLEGFTGAMDNLRVRVATNAGKSAG